MRKIRRSYLFMILGLIICSFGYSPKSNSREISIEIQPVFGNEKLILENHSYVTSANDTVQIDRFVFYFSSVNFFFLDGTSMAVPDSYHLVDFKPGENYNITFKNIPEGKLSRIEFYIGVDSAMSVSGAYGGDLDPMYGMYWTWNSGYINAKLEGRSKSCKTRNNGFEFHVGGYMSPDASLRKVSLDIPGNGNQSKIILTADAKSWFENISLAAMNNVVIPGKDAMKVADNYSKMFKVISAE